MKTAYFFIISSFLFISPLYADGTHPIGIKLDGTVGNAGKINLPGPDYQIRAELGKQVGSNLIHSFEQFNIHASESATFSGPASVKNIISRVTGGSASWIDGKLASTIPSASLHFLNPAGVMLGLNSSLDINGTFNLNTERYLKMSDAELLGSDISEDLYPRGIILDGTIGSSGKIGLQGPDYEIKAEYGRQVGANLFHSFEQFNILSGESAAFSGDNSVRYILSRVTGGNPSWINGKIISTIPNADMYFLNPSGVMFGLYAALGVSGSFHISTADYLNMGEHERFSALPTADELLSVSAPVSFGFLSDKPAEISSDGANLEVSEGKNISLIGGDIEIRKSTLTAPKGNVSIGGHGNIDMSDSLIQEGGGGSIIIRGGKFYSENTQFRIDASEDNNSLIDIDAENISMSQSWMNTMPAMTGKGGDILLNAAESVSFSETHIYTYTEGGMKNAGNVHIGADNISVGKSFINTSASGMGNGGEIFFDARNSVLCFGTNMSADTKSSAQAAGNAGNIRIGAGNISVTDSTLSSSTSSAGSGGNISLNAEESLILSKSAINSLANGDSQNSGNSGSIYLKAEDISFADGAVVSTSTYSQGHGGDVNINASETVSIAGSGSGIFTITSGFTSDRAGTGGNIAIFAKTLNLSDRGQIIASSMLGGQAGKIMLQVGSLSMNSGSSITSDSPLANAYTDFATIRDRDDRTLIAGDRIVISNVYNGKSSDTIYTGKTYVPCKTYYVRNISELNRLPDQHLIALGDIAEVGDAGDGKSGHFVYTDPSMGGWIRFDESKISEIADQSELSKINYQLYSDIGQAPYASGDLIRVTDAGNGKSGLYVYAMIQYDWGAFSNIIRLNHFYVGNTGEMNRLTGQYSVSDADMVSVKDSSSEFVFSQNRWVRLTDNIHSLSDWTEHEKLIPFAIGNVAEVRDGGDGTPKTFVYSGKEWITLNRTYSVASLSERDSLSFHTGDVVYTADDGAGKSADFLYDNGQWIKFLKSDSGTIEIHADLLDMKNKSKISSSTSGNGDASDIVLNVKNLQADSESAVSSESNSRYFGGDSGTITITADDSLKLLGKSYLTTNTADAGGGKISVHAEDSIYLNNSDITSSVKHGIGKGGDISTDSEFVILNQGNITANAQEGDGGAVFIRAENFLKSFGSIVEASSARGNNGTVRIEAPDFDISGSLAILPGTFLRAEQWIYDSCESRSGRDRGRFTIRRYVVPPDIFGEQQ